MMTFGEWLNGGRHKKTTVPFDTMYYMEESKREEERREARKLLEELKVQYPVLRAL